MTRPLMLVCLTLALIGPPTRLWAQPPGTTPAPAAPTVTPGTVSDQQVAAIVQKLGADAWTDREAADRELRQLGLKHADPVLNACLTAHVSSEDPEIEHRTLAIMREVVIQQVFHQQKGYLGVRLGLQRESVKVNNVDIFPIVAEQVMPNTAATAAGIKNGDKIIKIDDNLCTIRFGVTEMVAYISGKKPGQTISLTLWSGGKEVVKKARLRQRPTFATDPPVDRQKKEFFERWYNDKVRETRERLGQSDQSG